MAAAPHILARSYSEAHRFAREELGLQPGQYRVVTSAASIKSVRGAELHLVPGWKRRFDHFGFKGALRYTRMTVIDHEQVKAPVEPFALQPVSVTDDGLLESAGFFDGLTPPGTQLELLSTVEANTFLADTGEQGDQETEQAEMPVKRRRRRCKECGILVEPDEVESHAAEHLPEAD